MSALQEPADHVGAPGSSMKAKWALSSKVARSLGESGAPSEREQLGVISSKRAEVTSTGVLMSLTAPSAPEQPGPTSSSYVRKVRWSTCPEHAADLRDLIS